MRCLIPLFLLLTSSCKNLFITSNTALKNEIISYGIGNADTLVDIGCGDGEHDALISFYYPNLYFILEDVDPKLRKQIESYYNSDVTTTKNIKGNYKLVIGNENKIPLPSATYKLLLCRNAFHEFTDSTSMITEMRRILVSGGRLIIVEVEPKKIGEIAPVCKKPLITKETLINIFSTHSFTLRSAVNLPAGDKRTFNVLIFEKI